MKLRPYQTEAKNKIRNIFETGKKRIVLCKPTGAGKTVTFADIASDSVKNGFKVIIIVDRKELLEQAKDKLIKYGLRPSIITAGRRGRLNSESYIATVQTLVRRAFPDVDLIIIDECHKQTFDKLFERKEYLDKLVIGATATPIRSGKMKQLSDIYEDIVITTSISDLIKDGFLVPAITYGAKMEMKNVKTKGGDYDEKDMYEKIFNKPKLYDGVIEKYKHFAEGTKALCFNINIEHSKKTCAAFNAAGIPAVHLDGNTPKLDREKILRGFTNGFFRVLCNVDILTTGYDEWSVETIIVNRATKSLPLWLQMCGRGSRPTPIENFDSANKDKSHFNLIDMGGNTFRLGFWEQEREFSLTHKTKDKVDAAPVKECKEFEPDVEGKTGCGALVPASSVRCKICGYLFPQPKPTQLAEGEFLPLEYGETLPHDLIGKAWGTMSLDELERVRIAKGYKIGWIIKQILLRHDLTLLQYATFRDFKNPSGWVGQIEHVYKLNQNQTPLAL